MTHENRHMLANICLTVCSLLAMMVSAEIGIRIRAYYEDKRLFSEFVKYTERHPLPSGSEAGLGNMIRPVINDRIIYELLPGLSVRYAGTEVTTNSGGFRGHDRSKGKNANTIRIVGLGDSIMFGQGVADGGNYLSLLERLLAQNYKGKKWEVVNTGVPGYNTVMEVETLKEKGLAYKPDIVVVGFCVNDMSLPNFIRTKEDYFTLTKSFFVEFISQRISRVKKKFIALAFSPEIGRGRFEDDPAKVPPLYRDMVGWDAFETELTELQEISRQNNFDVVMFFFIPVSGGESQLQSRVVNLSKRLGFYIIDAGPSFNKYLSDNSTSWQNMFAVSSTDGHPNAEAHRIAANVLMADMAKQGIIKRLLTAAGRR